MPNTPSFGATTTAGGNGSFQGAQDVISNVFGVTPKYNTIHGDYYDPLESQGQQMRSQVYNTISGLYPQIMSNAGQTAGAMQQAAAAPGWGQAQTLATDTMGGKYLNGSPQLDNAMGAMRSASQASTANTNAGVRSQYAANGMSFGTPQMQAQQATASANTAQANQAEAAARLQNYQAERGMQNSAVNQLATATSTPLGYLSEMNNQYTQPLTQISQIVRGLSSGGTVAQPDTTVDKGFLSNLLGSVGSL